MDGKRRVVETKEKCSCRRTVSFEDPVGELRRLVVGHWSLSVVVSCRLP